MQLIAMAINWRAAFVFQALVIVRARERAGRKTLLSTALFRNRVSNRGLLTQNIQWLVLMGVSYAVSVFLQVVRGYNAIQTGLTSRPRRSACCCRRSRRAPRQAVRTTHLTQACFVLTIARSVSLLVGALRR